MVSTEDVRHAWEATGRAGASTLEARGLVAEDWLLGLCDEIDRLRVVLARIASPDEIVGMGVLEPILADPTGIAERELKARMEMAERAVGPDV